VGQGIGMQSILLGLGAIACIGGMILIGFGVPNHASNLGNLFITTGTMAAIGGLIMLGLASAIRQLRRIAQGIELRPMPRTIGPDLEIKSAARMPPPVVQASPLTTSRDNEQRPFVQAAREAAPTAQGIADPIDNQLRPAAQNDDISVQTEEETIGAATFESSPPPSIVRNVKPEVTFDALWPKTEGGEEGQGPGSAATPEVAHEEQEGRATEVSAEHPHGSEDVKIFKSGVIEGMAYTLYTDGSIEADLPQGRMRFASIEELSAHLGKRT
jgi:hypothetical protein